MSGESSSGVRRCLEAALELPAAERPAFLASLEARDAELAREVSSLLAADPEAVPELDSPLWRLLAGEPPPPERLGAYRLLQELGRGGSSVVYLAERCDGQFEHRVAIKLLRPGAVDAAFARRFLAERQILAGLEHPGIARLYDGGTTADGRPYVVLEAVAGEPIDRWCDARRATLAERLRLFQAVAAAVQYAHQNLVLHRDLKPGNILVTVAGEPKLLDFGIAKLLAPEAPALLETWPGSAPLTPAYASPEQVLGRPLTTSSDVYALGLLLHELLTGTRPFADAPSEPDRLHALLHEDPPRPSRALGSRFSGHDPEAVAAARGTMPSRLARALRGDLDHIVGQALAREPERRYATVAELAADLERYQAGLPVRARRGTWTYRARKLVLRRWREGVVAAAILVALATLGLDRWQEGRRTAEERDRARRVAEFLGGLFEPSREPGRKNEGLTARDLLDRGAERLERELGRSDELHAELAQTLGKAYRTLGAHEKASLHLEAAVALRRALPTSDPLAVADAVRELGALETSRGRFARAEELAREELSIRRRLQGRENVHTIDTQLILAAALYDLGRFDEAKVIHLEVLALPRSHPSYRPERAIAARDMLALLHHQRAEYPEAEALLRTSLAELEVLRGPADSQTRSTRANLAAAVLGQGKLEEAETLFRAVVARELETSGEDHPAVARARLNLAAVLLDLDRPHEALALVDQAFLGRLGGTHDDPGVFSAIHLRRATLRAALGDLPAALAEARRGLALRESAFGAEHPYSVQARVTLAELQLAGGDVAGAEAGIRGALDDLRADPQASPVLFAQAESILGGVLAARGEGSAAEPLLRRSWERLNTLRGPRSRATRLARERLAELEKGAAARAGAPD